MICLNKKTQFAIEFLILISLMLIIFVGFFAVITYRFAEVNEEKDFQDSADLGGIVVEEVKLANSLTDGYARLFYLPKKIEGNDYNITLLDNREVVVKYNDLELVFFLPDNVLGSIAPGYNMISKYDGVIYLNSEVNITYPTYSSSSGDNESFVPSEKTFFLLNSVIEILSLDNAGNAFLNGSILENAQPSKTASDELIIIDTSNNPIAIVNLDSGNMVIKGSLFENQAILNPSPGSNNIIFQNNSGEIIAYFDNFGNFYLRGIFNHSNETLCSDLDNDGYGLPASLYCNFSGLDCNDSDANINPGATESCNYIDDDCDGLVDEGVSSTYYADWDEDTYGNLTNSTIACSLPVGYVLDSSDCNDHDANINPGATELCNYIDDDCDGLVDEDFDLDTDNNNCGSCGNVCTGGTFCSSGVCILPTVAINISSSTYDVNLSSLFGDPVLPANYEVTIDSGVIVGSTSTSSAAMVTGAFPSGSTLKIINNGRIQGAGGTGNSNDGGDALSLGYPVTIDNNNQIWGGGGGGSRGDCGFAEGGGGGGAGYDPGAGGAGRTDQGAEDGQPGTTEAGGAGGLGACGTACCNGGAGGGPGEDGLPDGYGGGVVGIAGNSIQLNGFNIVWEDSGDIRGSIS